MSIFLSLLKLILFMVIISKLKNLILFEFDLASEKKKIVNRVKKSFQHYLESLTRCQKNGFFYVRIVF